MEDVFYLNLFGRMPLPTTLVPPNGADRDRTGDLRLAKPSFSQLNYSPTTFGPVMGLTGVEPVTFRLSGERSNRD